MQGIKGMIVVATIVGVAALVGACRKEVPHEPMKLGVDVPAAGQLAR